VGCSTRELLLLSSLQLRSLCVAAAFIVMVKVEGRSGGLFNLRASVAESIAAVIIVCCITEFIAAAIIVCCSCDYCHG